LSGYCESEGRFLPLLGVDCALCAFKGVEVNDELLKRKYQYIPKELLGQNNPVRYLNC